MFIYIVTCDCRLTRKCICIGLYECYCFGRYSFKNTTECPAFHVRVIESRAGMHAFVHICACVCAVAPSPKCFFVEYTAHKSCSKKKQEREREEGRGEEGREILVRSTRRRRGR